MISQEYIAAIVLVVGSILKVLKIEVAPEAIQGLIVGIIAVYIAYRRYKKGDITPLGKRKY